MIRDDSLKTAFDIFDHQRSLANLRVSDHTDFQYDPASSMNSTHDLTGTDPFLSAPSPPETLPLPDPDETYPGSAMVLEGGSTSDCNENGCLRWRDMCM